MRVLLLSPYGNGLARTIRAAGDQVVAPNGELNQEEFPNYDYIVMFGWRKIIKEPVLSLYKGRIINIHGSFLPWNRGASPNLFSWVNKTPKGATIHHVDSGIDSGPIIVRQLVDFANASATTTLKTSYEIIKCEAEHLFERSWPKIRAKKGSVFGTPQNPNEGSFHTTKEANEIIARLPNGWDTDVSSL